MRPLPWAEGNPVGTTLGHPLSSQWPWPTATAATLSLVGDGLELSMAGRAWLTGQQDWPQDGGPVHGSWGTGTAELSPAGPEPEGDNMTRVTSGLGMLPAAELGPSPEGQLLSCPW